jgi:hypothetical protein
MTEEIEAGTPTGTAAAPGGDTSATPADMPEAKALPRLPFDAAAMLQQIQLAHKRILYKAEQID